MRGDGDVGKRRGEGAAEGVAAGVEHCDVSLGRQLRGKQKEE